MHATHSARGLSPPTLESCFAAFFEALAEIERRLVEGQWPPSLSDYSEKLALERFDPNLHVTEYIMLRDCILALLERCEFSADPGGLRILHQVIDQGISAYIEISREQVHAERGWLATVLEQMPAGVLIGDTRCGRILLSNRQAEEIWRFPPPEPGKADAYRQYHGFHPEDGRPYEPEEWPLSRTSLKGEIVTNEEIDFLRGDGTRGTMLVSSAPIRDRNENLIAAAVIFHDISERKQVEKALRFLSTTSKLLAESMDPEETLCRTATLCVPDLADCSFATLLRNDQTIQKVALVTADPEKAARAGEKMASLPVDRHASHGLAQVLRTAESEFVPIMTDAFLAEMVTTPSALEWFQQVGMRSYLCVPLLSRGRVLGTLSLAMTTPDRRLTRRDLETAEEIGRRAGVALENAQLYEQARRAIEARQKVLAVVSHDLRNPLTAIDMNATLLLRKCPPGKEGERARQPVQRIIDSAQRMAGLIKDLLDTSSIDAGRFAVDMQDHDLDAVLTEALEMFRRRATQKSIRLRKGRGTPQAMIQCDRERILQVLSNLIGNAVKFTEKGGSISVGAQMTSDHVLVAVHDTGPGISEKDLPHIFDFYWQTEATARHHKGLGLGLAIAKEIVQAHGGLIWAESNPGQGSRFFFTLPVAAARLSVELSMDAIKQTA
jgi:signal transduction histidine kinase/PAS domain-containing protein